MGLIIDANSLEPVKGRIENEVVEGEFMAQDERDLTWKFIKAQVSKLPFEGAEKAKILHPFGFPKGEIYIKVIEEVAK